MVRVGKWELGCIIFNSIAFKLFSLYPDLYVKYGGSAAWHNSLFCGGLFLVALWFILKLYAPCAGDGLVGALQSRNKSALVCVVRIVFFIYFSLSAAVALYLVCCALKETAFPDSPLWYTGIFIIGAAFATVYFGKRAVYRMHSLCTFGIGITLFAIALLGFGYADVYNMTPVFGKGISDLYLKGIASLYMYSDIVVLFFVPYTGSKESYKRTVMVSALLAVVVNVLIMLSFSLNFPYELAERTRLIIYPLTKGASAGKFPIRLDVAYLLSLITSAILYLSICLSVGGGFLTKKIPKNIIATAISLMLCFVLCGCYDSSEVEERAYIIALGIDKGENSHHRYTFQISNPLQSGGNTDEKTDNAPEEGNKTVDNITLEAEDFYTAKTKLQAYLSKEPDMSHIKLIVLSVDVAQDDALSHSSLLLKEREVRPSTNVCLAESARDFLVGVKPTLEESTIRYYELMFRKEKLPYAPVVELRDFVGRCRNNGFDAVAPVYGEKGLWGMGMFNEGKLTEILTGDEVVVCNMLSGKLNNTGFYDGGDGAVVSSDGKPKVRIDVREGIPHINIRIRLKVKGADDADVSPEAFGKKGMDFLNKTTQAGCDVLGFGQRVKAGFLTQKEWEDFGWKDKYKKCVFSVNVMVENVKNK